jgi:hypothetical protein
MRSKDVVGKRIVRIHQAKESAGNEGYSPVVNVRAIELEDGTMLYPHTQETAIGEYFHTFNVTRVARKKKR